MLKLDALVKPVGVVAIAGLCLAVTNIDPVLKYGWGEDVGWLNWRDANGGADGVRVLPSFLMGYIWAENVGWINVGNGKPANGVAYANVDGNDFGVNRDPNTNQLYGLAWSENVGWLDFSGGALATPPNPARLNVGACALGGYVWGENIGWVNLAGPSAVVALQSGACVTLPGDMNCDGLVNNGDIDPFVLALTDSAGYGVAYPNCHLLNADINGDGLVNNGDIDAFVALLTGGG